MVLKGEREIYKGVKHAFFRPWESALFAGLCGNVISIPTGITFAIGIFNQSYNINIHLLWANFLPIHDRTDYDMWICWQQPILKRWGKKYFWIPYIKSHELYMDVTFDRKSKYYSYLDLEWNDETINKIISNL